MINVYCRDFGWLFEDLKRDIAAVGEDVIASNDPLQNADAWICVRTMEAARCPDPSRCVVQIHDFYEHPWLDSNRDRVGFVSVVHPDCKELASHVLPIGARRLFTLRDSMPERFTVGWVGRDVVYEGRHIKRPQLFVDAVLEARRGCEVVAKMYGEGLGTYAGQLGSENLGDSVDARQMYEYRCEAGMTRSIIRFGRDDKLRDFYHSLDALVVTCEPEPGPLSVYEALACGVPVIGTETGARSGAAQWCDLYCASADKLGYGIECIDGGERVWMMFDRRAKIRASVTHWQDDWAKAQVELARSLV